MEQLRERLQRADVGVMPLADTPWTRGKCGVKLLEYMAVGIPTVGSPVGINRDIVRNGENGFLAPDAEEWFDTLFSLVQNPGLRREIGLRGQETVRLRFTVDVLLPQFLEILENARHGRR